MENIIYLLLAFAAGINIIISTSINSALGKRIGLLNNAFIFYTIALASSIFVFLIFSTGEPLRIGNIQKVPYYVYFGALIPIVTLFLSTYAMQKFSVVNYVLITYIAEILTAVIIDYFISKTIQLPKITGAALMIIGLYMDNKIINE